MPFIRSTRDKRGYETTLVMHGYRTSQGAHQTRVLYLFRSPSHVRLGRQPLDEEAREALEHTHPDLSFDWQALGRETIRTDEREAWRGRRGQAPGRAKASAAAEPVAVVETDDQSLLGQTLGAERAARFRARYAGLLHRVARRFRTPEQRDRLTEQAQRLNPDEWPDADTIRARAETVEAEWDALAAELPARRRGRRGGRRRDERPGESPSPDEGPAGAPASESSAPAVIMDEGEVDARQIAVETVRSADPGGSSGDADRGGPESDGTAGDDLSGRHQLRQD